MKSAPAAAVWSAVPTPLTTELTVDADSVVRMVNAAVAEGVAGLFIAGTCGEGPWLPDRERQRLMRITAEAAAGRLKIAAQVSDNSVPRILDNAAMAAACGVDIAVIAPPATMLNATPARVAALFIETAARCPLPVGVYDLGHHRAVAIPEDRLEEVYLAPNIVLVKDSSGSPARRAIALAARARRPDLQLFNGDEFRCVEYLTAGYDGCLFGGAAVVMPQLRRIVALCAAGNLAEAERADAALRDILHGIYGGKSIACWLTGLKYCLVRQGIFATTASFLDYPLTAECRDFIDRYVASTAAHRPTATLVSA